MKERLIKIIMTAKVVETKDNKFLSWSGIDYYGQPCNYKFTKAAMEDVKEPKKAGTYLVHVKVGDINSTYRYVKETQKHYLDYWIKKVDSIELSDDE